MSLSIPLRPESPRYTARLLFLPDLWAPASLWLRVGGFLGHRGWEGELLELRGAGSLADRAEIVLERVAGSVERPVVLIGHGAGGLVALDVARRTRVAAVVLVAPLVPGSAQCRRLIARWDAFAAIALGRDIPPPCGARARRLFGEVPAGLEEDTARAVLDSVRGRRAALPAVSVPALVVSGECDPLLPRDAAVELVSAMGAEHVEIAGAGHWPLVPPSWRSSVGVVHRWLVRRLGEPLLELYADAMAERDGGD